MPRGPSRVCRELAPAHDGLGLPQMWGLRLRRPAAGAGARDASSAGSTPLALMRLGRVPGPERAAHPQVLLLDVPWTRVDGFLLALAGARGWSVRRLRTSVARATRRERYGDLDEPAARMVVPAPRMAMIAPPASMPRDTPPLTVTGRPVLASALVGGVTPSRPSVPGPCSHGRVTAIDCAVWAPVRNRRDAAPPQRLPP